MVFSVVLQSHGASGLGVIPKQRLIEVHRQIELVQADILVFSVDRGILLLVNINRRKSDDRIGKAGKPPCVRARRKNEGHRRRIGKGRFYGFLIYRWS